MDTAVPRQQAIVHRPREIIRENSNAELVAEIVYTNSDSCGSSNKAKVTKEDTNLDGLKEYQVRLDAEPG